MQGIRTYWLPVGQQRAGSAIQAYWVPEVGENVLVTLDPTGSGGCVLASIYSVSNPPQLTGSGLYVITVPRVVVVGDLDITGSITVAGDVAVTGAVTVEGSHAINGKDTVVVGSKDSGGDTNSESGQ